MREHKELLISRFEDIKANYRLYMWPRGWSDNVQLVWHDGSRRPQSIGLSHNFVLYIIHYKFGYMLVSWHRMHDTYSVPTTRFVFHSI